eukprot:TRINITY_DN48926_c0_g1_i1.p1 TRINITY_DN48926_c0_g1~~TRINITY_DN48926_c0_g1_i1.p1  ORF type:complete len:398 (-),score=21.54 TRINITY_DN48926_c0_g1_i1:407-1600(-)
MTSVRLRRLDRDLWSSNVLMVECRRSWPEGLIEDHLNSDHAYLPRVGSGRTPPTTSGESASYRAEGITMVEMSSGEALARGSADHFHVQQQSALTSGVQSRSPLQRLTSAPCVMLAKALQTQLMSQRAASAGDIYFGSESSFEVHGLYGSPDAPAPHTRCCQVSIFILRCCPFVSALTAAFLVTEHDIHVRSSVVNLGPWELFTILISFAFLYGLFAVIHRYKKNVLPQASSRANCAAWCCLLGLLLFFLALGVFFTMHYFPESSQFLQRRSRQAVFRTLFAGGPVGLILIVVALLSCCCASAAGLRRERSLSSSQTMSTWKRVLIALVIALGVLAVSGVIWHLQHLDDGDTAPPKRSLRHQLQRSVSDRVKKFDSAVRAVVSSGRSRQHDEQRDAQ